MTNLLRRSSIAIVCSFVSLSFLAACGDAPKGTVEDGEGYNAPHRSYDPDVAYVDLEDGGTFSGCDSAGPGPGWGEPDGASPGDVGYACDGLGPGDAYYVDPDGGFHPSLDGGAPETIGAEVAIETPKPGFVTCCKEGKITTCACNDGGCDSPAFTSCAEGTCAIPPAVCH